MKQRWKKIALALLLVFAVIGIGTTVFIIPFACHYFRDMNRKVDAPIVSVPFNIRQARSKQVIMMCRFRIVDYLRSRFGCGRKPEFI